MDRSRKVQEIEKFLGENYLDLEFGNDFGDYRCTKCKRVYILAHVANCTHVFCKNCMEILGDGVKGRKCPSCAELISNFKKYEDLEHQKKFSELKVVCPFKKNACDFHGMVKDVVDHVKSCPVKETAAGSSKGNRSFKRNVAYGDNVNPSTSFDREQPQTDSSRSTFQNSSAFLERTVNLPVNKYNAVLGKTYNVLLLGKTGVGKSTFINAFCNYLKFENLKAAEKPEVLIACHFTLPIEDFRLIKICFGDDPNEDTGDRGQSATQNCRPYEFNINNFKLRIIDTPGIGDTRGIDQDKLKLEKIMNFLSKYDELHAICILLKPNQARCTPPFAYCIKQLLGLLHQKAKKNIVFVFTNSRCTFYKPGDTVKPLQAILKQVKEFPPYPEIPFQKNNTFCFDNEAFRFLIASKNNYAFDEDDFNNSAFSWDQSKKESERLIKYIINGVEGQGMTPHLIRESIRINNCKQIIVELSKPLSEIATTIQQNLHVLSERKKEIEDCKNYQDKLRKLLYRPHVTLDIKELDHPRTVCSGEKCRKLYKIGQLSAFHYPISCHNQCHELEKKVKKDVIGDQELLQCWAFDSKSENCNICGCHYRKHLHIYYSSETKDVKIINESIQRQLNTKEAVLNAAKENVEQLENEIIEYENQIDKLTTYTAKLAIYLKQNAMVVVNDSYGEYLKELIENQRALSQSDYNNETVIKRLRRMLESYKKEKDILDRAMSSSSQQQQISLEDVENVIFELGNMQNTGELFQEVYEATSKTVEKSMEKLKQFQQYY